jgi:hypothetical protein
MTRPTTSRDSRASRIAAFETVTYMLAGRMWRGNNKGNVGLLARAACNG